jgi:hypothetical protein
MNTDKNNYSCLTVQLLKADSDRPLAAEDRDSIPDKVYLVFVVDTVTEGLTPPPGDFTLSLSFHQCFIVIFM